jgi:hypothetical protein
MFSKISNFTKIWYGFSWNFVKYSNRCKLRTLYRSNWNLVDVFRPKSLHFYENSIWPPRWPSWIFVIYSNRWIFWTLWHCERLYWNLGEVFTPTNAMISRLQILPKPNMAATATILDFRKILNRCNIWTFWLIELKFGGSFHTHKSYVFHIWNFTKI